MNVESVENVSVCCITGAAEHREDQIYSLCSPLTRQVFSQILNRLLHAGYFSIVDVNFSGVYQCGNFYFASRIRVL